MKSFDEKNLSYISNKHRLNILKLAKAGGANSSHFGGALSSVDILSVLFENFFIYDQNENKKFIKDQFILSKGHACLALYSVLKELKIIEEVEFESFEKDGSFLAGHPVKNYEKGINYSTGSLGMGISLAVGIAIYNKLKENNFITYVLMGDGECNEGSVWESAMLASAKNLNNLVVIIDNNKFQQTGSNLDILDTGDLKKKWESFNWQVIKCDGHNYFELYDAFNSKKGEKPLLILANTIKGKGFSFSENNNDWHHKILTSSQYEEAIKELENDN